MERRALVTGVTGQDGSLLAELLLSKGYEVHGLVRRCSRPATGRVEHLDKLVLHEGDLTDDGSLQRVVALVQPDEVYNLGAQSFVAASFDQPILTAEVTGLGTVRMLEAVRSQCPAARFYQASSSEMFGSAPAPQSETTAFAPRSPYAAAKVYAHQMTINYRESYGLHASCGILFNHESKTRGVEFLTRKVTQGVAKIVVGQTDVLALGNLDAQRDWGHARDYVRAMWLMLQQDKPDDYVVATGQAHTVKDFVAAAFFHAGLDWCDYVKLDPRFLRPAEVHCLQGDASKAKSKLGWEPQITFDELVEEMVEADLQLLRQARPTLVH